MIQSDPAVMMGKPVIADTRVTVEFILEQLAADETTEQILDAHPRLTEAAISAALEFAARALKAEVTYPLPDRGGMILLADESVDRKIVDRLRRSMIRARAAFVRPP